MLCGDAQASVNLAILRQRMDQRRHFYRFRARAKNC
jgi:hypothetical protein